MAISITQLKGLTSRTPSPGKGKAQAGHTTMIMQGVRKLADREPGRVPFVGHLSVDKQYLYVGGALIISLLFAAGLTIYSTVTIGNKAQYEAKAGQLTMLSQRLPLTAQQAALGNAGVFKKLAAAKTAFNDTLMALMSGDRDLPASPGVVRDELNKIAAQWEQASSEVDAILNQESALVALGQNIRNINEVNVALLELTEQLSSILKQSDTAARELSLANQQVMLTQRIAKNANALLAADVIDPKNALQLEKDVKSFHGMLYALLEGSTALNVNAVRNSDARRQLEDIAKEFKDLEKAVGSVLSNTKYLVAAKQASHSLFSESDRLLSNTQALGKEYANLGSAGYGLATLLFAVSVGSLILLGMVNINETKSRARKSEEENRRNQEAILRLMDELGELAEGNLSINASVTENITGAIADSINFTVEELRSLVRGINNATVQLDIATRDATQVSEQLSAAARRQAKDIEDTSLAVVDISQSIQKVSANAVESANVAQQSLSAAEKGQQAVQNTISGMNALREQIQETSKRIKRLGESSQEIGEIVELISDITEQTNVLALNAAIQAASAGEAGRGFSVVAEEVQRLAERSAEATKQIAAIVKTIQTDTQDTVAAMETSTQAVVEGARLSDAAGRTLNEIGGVSRRLAGLIADISNTTQSQADATAKVAETMQQIRKISMQTSEGTQKTAQSLGSLTKLADTLKNSVSGFKLA
jgi:twitching motility protein PilJ